MTMTNRRTRLDNELISEGFRAVILETLDEMGCPISHRDIMPYLEAFFGIHCSAGDLEALALDDREALLAGRPREVMICPAIGPTLAADWRLFTRSDKALATRIMGPSSERVRQLWLIERYCGFVMIGEERGLETLDLLVQEATRRAGSLPADRLQEYTDISVRVNSSHLTQLARKMELWRSVAEDEYTQLAGADRAERQALADTLSEKSLESKLFGLS
jgi:hypothetical protein